MFNEIFNYDNHRFIFLFLITSTSSPCTPKTELREKIVNLRSEFNTLREFTTLEKQLLQSDCIAAANVSKMILIFYYLFISFIHSFFLYFMLLSIFVYVYSYEYLIFQIENTI